MTASGTTKLENALSRLEPQSLELLALVHVTIGRWLSKIVRVCELRPQHCKVFQRKVAYFSYGAPYYRPANRQTEDALELPIAFVFDPGLLDKFTRFYPFDTGAIAAAIFGDTWKTQLGNFEELHITHDPQRLVSCFYSTNTRYLSGQVRRSVPKIEPLSTIRNFLSSNLSAEGADQRQRTIECIAEHPISLLEYLRGVFYPEPMSATIRRLWKQSSSKFTFYPYVVDANENPSALVTHIEKVFKEKFKYMWVGP